MPEYAVLDKNTIKIWIMPYLSVARRGLTSKSNLPVHYAGRHFSFGRHLRKFLWTEGIAERLRIR